MVSCEKHPDADALYVEQIELGDATGPRTIISGLANFVPLEEMQGKLVAVLCNLKPQKMRGIMSEGMVLCGSNADHTGVEILEPPEGSEVGEHLFLDSFGCMKPVRCLPYRGNSLKRNCLLLGTYSRTILRVLWWSWGGGCFL